MSNLKLADEYFPNIDYHFDRIDKRKPIKLDDLLEQLRELTGGGVFTLIFQLGDEWHGELDGVDVYDVGMAAKLLAECDGKYLIDRNGVVVAGDKYKLKELMLKKWNIDDGKSS